ncbi:recombinase RecA [Klebsiella pneumoniae]|uniref:recombinase RecA n=1 Tax=Klebsiella pneumoniae TaxID=573 RepID=UPI00193A347E|nr:recombinase RecA [Klebsiella pneumoniae]MBM2681821.1 recombinase RecA [Klebsiella pneumoniae]
MERDEYISPKWGTGSKVHNWLNYAEPELIAIWDTFSEEQQKVIALTLEEVANREEYY